MCTARNLYKMKRITVIAKRKLITKRAIALQALVAENYCLRLNWILITQVKINSHSIVFMGKHNIYRVWVPQAKTKPSSGHFLISSSSSSTIPATKTARLAAIILTERAKCWSAGAGVQQFFVPLQSTPQFFLRRLRTSLNIICSVRHEMLCLVLRAEEAPQDGLLSNAVHPVVRKEVAPLRRAWATSAAWRIQGSAKHQFLVGNRSTTCSAASLAALLTVAVTADAAPETVATSPRTTSRLSREVLAFSAASSTFLHECR